MTSFADTENSTTGNEPRCSCGAGPHPTLPGRCAGKPSHFMRGNRAASITGHHGAAWRREHEAEIRAMADEIARDYGYRSFDAAPLTFRIVARGLARTTKVEDTAYWRMMEIGGPVADSGKERRAYRVWADTNSDLARDLKGVLTELARQPVNERQSQVAQQFEGMSLRELADYANRLADEEEALRAGYEPQFTHRDQPSSRDLPTLDTRPVPNAGGNTDNTASRPTTSTAPAARSVMITSGPIPIPRPDSVRPPAAPPVAASRPVSAAPPATEDDGTPVIYVYNRRVTEADVRRCLRDSGDLPDYDAGRIPKVTAFRLAATWIRNAMEMPR